MSSNPLNNLDQSTITSFLAAVLAVITAGARLMSQGPPFKFWTTMSALISGALIGGLTSQALLEYKIVSPQLAIWIAGLLGAAGEHIIMFIWQLSKTAKDDPLGTLGKIFGWVKNKQPPTNGN